MAKNSPSLVVAPQAAAFRSHPLCVLVALTLLAAGGCRAGVARHDASALSSATFFDGATGQSITAATVQKRLRRRHVYVGERHGDAAFHRVQLQVIQALSASGPIAVGVEWLNRDQQPTIDAYIAGRMDWDRFDVAVGLSKRWTAKTSAQHRRILSWCREQRVPVLGLNAPAGLARVVATGGAEAVSGAMARWLPPLDTGNAAHKLWFADLMRESAKSHGAHGGHHAVTPGMLERYYRAQLVWDESMAIAASDFLNSAPSHTLIVLAGLGHVDFGHGIPSRVRARTEAGFAIVRPLETGARPTPEGSGPYPGRVCDVFWESPR